MKERMKRKLELKEIHRKNMEELSKQNIKASDDKKLLLEQNSKQLRDTMTQLQNNQNVQNPKIQKTSSINLDDFDTVKLEIENQRDLMKHKKRIIDDLKAQLETLKSEIKIRNQSETVEKMKQEDKKNSNGDGKNLRV